MLAVQPVSVQQLGETLAAVLGGKAKSVKIALGEVTVTVAAADYLAIATLLRDAPGTAASVSPSCWTETGCTASI